MEIPKFATLAELLEFGIASLREHEAAGGVVDMTRWIHKTAGAPCAVCLGGALAWKVCPDLRTNDRSASSLEGMFTMVDEGLIPNKLVNYMRILDKLRNGEVLYAARLYYNSATLPPEKEKMADFIFRRLGYPPSFYYHREAFYITMDKMVELLKETEL